MNYLNTSNSKQLPCTNRQLFVLILVLYPSKLSQANGTGVYISKTKGKSQGKKINFLTLVWKRSVTPQQRADASVSKDKDLVLMGHTPAYNAVSVYWFLKMDFLKVLTPELCYAP
jgi:hypothetical protein